MKIGKEVEGRYKGVQTIFMSADEVKAGVDWRANRRIGPQQDYISDLKNELDLDDNKLYTWAEEVFVTVEVTELKRVPPEHLHIILRVDASSFKYLWSTNQVKFEPGPRLVYMMPVEMMIKTYADAYDSDKVIG